jgi:hypothetical protein
MGTRAVVAVGVDAAVAGGELVGAGAGVDDVEGPSDVE